MLLVHLRRSRDDVYGEQLFRVDRDDLQPGNYTIGIFNMDYFVHQTFSYQLMVRAGQYQHPCACCTYLCSHSKC